MTMLERCARALWACDQGSIETPFENLSPCALDNLYDAARAVLEALKEPTPEMVSAAEALPQDELADAEYNHRAWLRDGAERRIWTAMLTQALKDHP